MEENTINQENNTNVENKETEQVPVVSVEQFEAMKAQLSEYQTKENEDKVKKGEFEGLYNQAITERDTFKSKYEEAKGRVESQEAVINTILTNKLQGISEDYKELIPDNLSVEGQLAWVEKAEQKGLFGKKTDQTIGDMTNDKTKKNTVTIDILNKMTYGERARFANENPAIYKQLMEG